MPLRFVTFSTVCAAWACARPLPEKIPATAAAAIAFSAVRRELEAARVLARSSKRSAFIFVAPIRIPLEKPSGRSLHTLDHQGQFGFTHDFVNFVNTLVVVR